MLSVQANGVDHPLKARRCWRWQFVYRRLNDGGLLRTLDGLICAHVNALGSAILVDRKWFAIKQG